MILTGVSLTCLYLAIEFYSGSLVFFILKKKRTMEFFFTSGFLFHTISQVSRGWFIGIFTPVALFEEVFFLPWCLAFLFLGLRFLEKDTDLIYTSIIPVFFFSILTLFVPKGIVPPSPNMQTFFAPMFFLFEVLAHACFVMGAWFAFRYLRHREEARFFDSFIIWGFIFYSIAQVTGAIWCYSGWATLFNWSSRHLQSAAIWCFYAAYMHLRFLSVRDIKKKAGFSIAGFALVVFLSTLGYLNEMNMPRLGG
jgi:hypothetical protein